MCAHVQMHKNVQQLTNWFCSQPLQRHVEMSTEAAGKVQQYKTLQSIRTICISMEGAPSAQLQISWTPDHPPSQLCKTAQKPQVFVKSFLQLTVLQAC